MWGPSANGLVSKWAYGWDSSERTASVSMCSRRSSETHDVGVAVGVEVGVFVGAGVVVGARTP